MMDFLGQQRARPRFTAKEKQLLYQHQGGKCNGCKKKFDMRNLAVDHIKAFSREGSDRAHNLQLLCTACNSAKGAGTMGQLQQRLKKQGVVKGTTNKTASKTTSAKKTSSSTGKTKKKPTTKKGAAADPCFF